MVKSVIDELDSLGRTPLAQAVTYEFTASTELLLRFGADPNRVRCTKESGFSPLIYLAIASPCATCMDADILTSVRVLVQAGADLNLTDSSLREPFRCYGTVTAK